MAPVDEIAHAINTFIETLRTQPLSLAMMVMNICLLIFLFYAEMRHMDNRRFALKALIEQQAVIAQILSHCIVLEELHKFRDSLPKIPPD
jgi:hypothetical protein